MQQILLEVTVTVDDDEVDTEEKLKAKVKEVCEVIESLDPGIGVFEVGPVVTRLSIKGKKTDA